MYSYSHYLQHIDDPIGKVELTVGTYEVLITGGLYVNISRHDWLSIIHADSNTPVQLEPTSMFANWGATKSVKVYQFVVEKFGLYEIHIIHPDAIEVFKSQLPLWNLVLKPPKRALINVRIQRL